MRQNKRCIYDVCGPFFFQIVLRFSMLYAVRSLLLATFVHVSDVKYTWFCYFLYYFPSFCFDFTFFFSNMCLALWFRSDSWSSRRFCKVKYCMFSGPKSTTIEMTKRTAWLFCFSHRCRNRKRNGMIFFFFGFWFSIPLLTVLFLSLLLADKRIKD